MSFSYYFPRRYQRVIRIIQYYSLLYYFRKNKVKFLWIISLLARFFSHDFDSVVLFKSPNTFNSPFPGKIRVSSSGKNPWNIYRLAATRREKRRYVKRITRHDASKIVVCHRRAVPTAINRRICLSFSLSFLFLK